VRKKLQLGQHDAAEIFCGGIKAFSRYENGKTQPPVALAKFSSCWIVSSTGGGGARSLTTRYSESDPNDRSDHGRHII
jgi:hypothetical protein